jgi:hypothetical protein
MAKRELLGANLPMNERIQLAQLAIQPGWTVLVKLMAEACRNATEEVIRLDPTKSERYTETVSALQMTARAINKFSGEVLDSVKMHQQIALNEIKESQELEEKTNTRFKGFQMPAVPVGQESPVEGAQDN